MLWRSNAWRRQIQATSPIVRAYSREVPVGCGKNTGLIQVYVDNMHKHHTVRVTLRKHSQEGDDDTEYAVAEGGHLFVGCGGGGTSFAVVRCEVLKGQAEKVISEGSN